MTTLIRWANLSARKLNADDGAGRRGGMTSLGKTVACFVLRWSRYESLTPRAPR